MFLLQNSLTPTVHHTKLNSTTTYKAPNTTTTAASTVTMAAGGKRGKSTTTSTKPKTKKSKSNHHHLQHPYNLHLNEDLIALITSATSAAHSFLLRHDLHLLPSQLLSLESLFSSTYSFLLPQLPPSPTRPLSSLSWFHRLLSSSNTDHDPRWANFFHLSKPTFYLLLSLLSPSLASSLPTITPDIALAAALFRLSHGASYKSVARRFGFDSSSITCRVFYRVCKAVNAKFGDLLDFGSDIGRIVVGFGWISLPNCCGVLGFGRFGVD